MATLTIKSFPDALHAKLRQSAAAQGHSVPQEALRLLEITLTGKEQPAPVPHTESAWARRKVLPEYEAAIKAGAFSGGTDSTQILSEERDAR